MIREKFGSGWYNITRCCTEVCPEHINSTDNGIIPLKERVADRYYDPFAMMIRKLFGKKSNKSLPVINRLGWSQALRSACAPVAALLLVALLCGGCAAHLQGLPTPGVASDTAGKRDPLSALSVPVLARFLAAQLVLAEEVAKAGSDDRADRAVALLEEAVALSPGQAVLWRYLASAWASKPDPQKALTAARRAVDLDESDALSRYVLGLQLLRNERYDDAEEQLVVALRYGLSAGSQYLPYYYLYEVRRQRGDPDGALAALDDWKSRLPDSPDPLMLEAKLLWRLGRGAEAVPAAVAALRAEPRSSDSLRILLDASVLDPLTAISGIEAALKSDWSVRELHRELVGQYRAIGRFDRALDHLVVLRTLSALGSLAFLEDEARLRLSMAQGEEVLALLDEALAVGRRVDGRFLSLLADTYKVLDRRNDGIARLWEFAEIVPEQAAHIEAEVATLSTHPSVAPRSSLSSEVSIESIEKASAALRPNWKQSRPATSAREFSERLEAERQRINLQLRLSFLQREKGDRPACELTLLDLLSRHPLLGVALNALAYLWAEDGRRLDEALILQERALEQEPFSGAFQDTMGWIQFRRGRLDEALRHLELADRYQPYEAEIIEHLAEVLRASGMAKEAQEHDLRARALRDRASPR